MATNTQSSVLDRLLEPLVVGCFTPAVAEQVVQYQADAQTQARLDKLSDKCTEGELTLDEKAEYEDYVHAIELITVLQAKARDYLKSLPNA